MSNERIITTISLSVALAIGTSEFINEIERFSREATENEYTDFTHYSFFYSYPGWGKKWPNGKSCEFHRVHTKCHLCNYMPGRNYAGIGSIYVLNNGVCNSKVLIKKDGKKILVPNTSRLSRMILLCPEHVASHFRWNKYPSGKRKFRQLELF